MPTFGSLFAGIGGIDLGLERAGWTGRWQVEWNGFAQHNLAHHWPDVPRHGDITRVDWSTIEPVDLIAGGFPCQPFSFAGKQRGIEDDRWLWPEFARAIRALRPRFVLVENVPGLLAGHGGMGHVVGSLAELGYDAEWDSIPAAAVGAPHLRYRVWIVAHDDRRDWRAPRTGEAQAGAAGHVVDGGPSDASRGDAPHPYGYEYQGDASSQRWPATTLVPSDADRWGREGFGFTRLLDGFGPSLGYDSDGCGCALADADIARLEGHRRSRGDGEGAGEWLAGPSGVGHADGASPDALTTGGGSRGAACQPGWWSVEPNVGRVAHGVPARVDRLRALGNAVVPQIPELIGRRLLELMAERAA